MPPLPLIQLPSTPPIVRTDSAAQPNRLIDLYRAVDFDNLIIHGQHYTWDTWQNTGRWAYPTCQPVPDQYINQHAVLFVGFLDGRYGER